MYLALCELRQRSDDVNKIDRKVANGSSSNVLSHEPVVAHFVEKIKGVPLL